MTTAGYADVEDRLAVCGTRVRDEIAAHLPTGDPDTWLYELVADYPARRAKSLRPALCLAACEAFGGDAHEAMPSAVAIR